MQDLRVIGVENGALLVASVEGTRFRIPIDEVLQSKLRQAVPEPGAGRKLAPREIQAHIRSGMSAQDVSSITGVPLDYIQKFEGPVLAEREHVVNTALAVPVHTAMETDPLAQGSTFGSVIRERLYGLNAINERWASWKETGNGWVVKLAFTIDENDHDARWNFDPKKLALAPANNEAVTLSQQGESSGGLIPRLRAVSSDDPDSSRFDSGAFDVSDVRNGDARNGDNRNGDGRNGDGRALEPHVEPAPRGRLSASSRTEQPQDNNQTADLLEALRRRRGEREAASSGEVSPPSLPSPMHPSSAGIRIVDIPLDDFEESEEKGRSTAPQPFSPQPFSPQQAKGGRKGRQSMPTWDEIVFGARSDDDLG